MTKQELFKKYSINETHDIWTPEIDDWMSIEIYRIMHDGNLPLNDDMSINWIVEFLNKTKDIKFMSVLMTRKDWGSLYLTAKRMVYRFAEQFVETK